MGAHVRADGQHIVDPPLCEAGPQVGIGNHRGRDRPGAGTARLYTRILTRADAR